MPNGFKKFSPELADIIREQSKDRTRIHEYPEKIRPQSPLLFGDLATHEKATFILSMFMKQSEISQVMKVSTRSVQKYLERGRKKLPPDERKKYEDIRLLKKYHTQSKLIPE